MEWQLVVLGSGTGGEVDRFGNKGTLSLHWNLCVKTRERQAGEFAGCEKPDSVHVVGEGWQPGPGQAPHLGAPTPGGLLRPDPLSGPLRVCRKRRARSGHRSQLVPIQEAKSNTNKNKALGWVPRGSTRVVLTGSLQGGLSALTVQMGKPRPGR